MLNTQMLIGSNFVAGTEAPESVVNPKTEETIVKLPDASPAQVDAAVNAAAKAFQSWSRTTPAERSGLLLKLADAIDRDVEAFATLEALNCGKPRIRVLQDEMPAISDCFRFFAGAVRNMHGPVAGEYMAGHTSMIRRDPALSASHVIKTSPNSSSRARSNASVRIRIPYPCRRADGRMS